MKIFLYMKQMLPEIFVSIFKAFQGMLQCMDFFCIRVCFECFVVVRKANEIYWYRIFSIKREHVGHICQVKKLFTALTLLRFFLTTKKQEKHTTTCSMARKRCLNAHLFWPFLYMCTTWTTHINKKDQKQKSKKLWKIPEKVAWLNKSKDIML